MLENLRRLWSNPRYRYLFLARFVSNIGNGMTPIALAFGVLSLPGADATDLSYVTTSQMVPIVVFLLFGGVVADRIGRARLVGGTDVLGSIVVAANAILFLTGQATILVLCINGALFGVLNALWYPAFSGLMPEVVPSDQLQAGNSVMGFASNVGFTIGASSAGVIVSTIGSGWAILVDASSFLVAGLLVWQLRTPRTDTPVESVSHERETMWHQMREGWYEFRSRTWLVVVVATFALANMCFEGFLGVLAPLQMKEEFSGARDMGWMMFAWGAGSIAGVIVSMRIRAEHPLRIAMAAAPFIGVWMLVTAIAAPLPIVMFVAFLTGISLDIFYVMWMTTFQRHVPEESLSRVGSFDAFGSTVFAPIGLFLAGPTATWIGTEPTLFVAGSVAIVACLGALGSKSVRDLT